MDPINVELVNDKDFEKSQREIEQSETIEETKYPQDYNKDQPIALILDDLNEKETIDFRVQAVFKRSGHMNISIFIISQDYYGLPEKTILVNGNMHHRLKPNKFRVVRNLYQDKASMDNALKEFKFLTSTCWNEKYQPINIEKTNDKHTGRYRVGQKSLFVSRSKTLWTNYMCIYPIVVELYMFSWTKLAKQVKETDKNKIRILERTRKKTFSESFEPITQNWKKWRNLLKN